MRHTYRQRVDHLSAVGYSDSYLYRIKAIGVFGQARDLPRWGYQLWQISRQLGIM